jgi:hypothetical protein
MRQRMMTSLPWQPRPHNGERVRSKEYFRTLFGYKRKGASSDAPSLCSARSPQTATDAEVACSGFIPILTAVP